MLSELLRHIERARLFDLSQPLYAGMPHHPNHPPFMFVLTRRHGEVVLPGTGASSAAEAFSMGGHVGTHFDALCHFAKDGRIHGGRLASEVSDYLRGVAEHSVDTVGLIARRGVLLDVAGDEPLPEDFTIEPRHLEECAGRAKVEVEPGDVVLIRTGWARYWDNPVRFINEGRAPGPGLAAARWLSARRIFAAGSDTTYFEKVPSDRSVHIHLLVESGIHIMEALNLEELAAAGARVFLFVAAPLKIRGGTGSPIRPFAVVFGG
ncbi:MAG: cyclase family protein [Bryobacteraceae bacterium]